jgi:hypothetical protein
MVAYVSLASFDDILSIAWGLWHTFATPNACPITNG